jgi:hypothetical protein
MPQSVTNSAVHVPTTVQSHDQEVEVTAQHKSAAETGAVVTKGLDTAAEASQSAGQYAADSYVAGKDSAGKAAAQVSETSRDAYDASKEKVGQASEKAKQLGKDGYVKGKETLEQAGSKTKEAGAKAYGAAAHATQRVNAEARGWMQRTGDSWSRGLSAASNERPITFLGLNSVPLATAGVIGLAVGLAGLFTAFTIYIPLSWVLISIGTVSLLDLTTSLMYRSKVKGRDPSARPLTALAEHGSTSTSGTEEERMARILSECRAFTESAELKKRGIDDEADALNTNVIEVRQQIEMQQNVLADLTQRHAAIIQRQNENVIEIPIHVRQALEAAAAGQQSVEKSQRDLRELQNNLQVLAVTQETKQSEVQARLAAVKKVSQELNENAKHAKSVREVLARLDQQTDTHTTSESTVKLETGKRLSKNKGKARETTTTTTTATSSSAA